MRRVKKILLYASPDAPVGPALAGAVHLARREQGVVTLADCMRRLPTLVRWVQPERWNRHAEQVHARQTQLDEWADELRRRGTPAVTQMLFGNPLREISREVLHRGYDLVLKTADGSVARPAGPSSGASMVQLVRRCPCQVCVLDGVEVGCKQIVATVNPQATESRRCELNRLVLETAVDLGRQEGSQTAVVAAWSVFAESIVRLKFTEDDVACYVESTRAEASRRLEEILRPFRDDIDPANVHLVRGEPQQVISKYVQEHATDMLVVGAVPRRGLSGMLLGNTAEDVMRLGRCNVLVVKPNASRS